MSQDSPRNLPPVQMVPRSPLVQSQNGISDILRVEQHQQPAHGTSDCCLPSCLVSLHLGQPIQLNRTIDGQRSSDRLSEGDLMITPPDVHRKLSWDADAQFLLLRLEPKLLAAALPEPATIDPPHIIPQLKLRDPLIQQIGLALKTELDRDGLSDRLYAESLANALAVHMLRRYSTRTPSLHTYADGLSGSKLQQAIDYMQAHLADEISLETIAATVGLSRYYFCRLFKQSTGVSPYQYLLECRIERAKRLLSQGQQSITNIAIQVGFANQSQFGRHFKRLTGVTPKQFGSRSQ